MPPSTTGACVVIARIPPAQSIASTLVPVWFLAVTMSLWPKRPAESNVIPSGASVAGRLTKRLAPPSAPIRMTPGRFPGCSAKVVPLLNEHRAPATRSSPARVMYGSGPSAVE